MFTLPLRVAEVVFALHVSHTMLREAKTLAFAVRYLKSEEAEYRIVFHVTVIIWTHIKREFPFIHRCHSGSKNNSLPLSTRRN